MTILDVFLILLIMVFALYGQMIGAIPAAANLIIATISAMLAVSLGCVINLPILEVLQEPTASTLVSTFFVFVLFERILKLLFIPKGLAKDLYIESPSYYIPGLVLGILQGYILYSLAIFALLFGGNQSILDKSESSFFTPIIGTSYKMSSFFAPNKFREELQAMFDKFNRKTSKLPDDTQFPERQTILDGNREKDGSAAKITEALGRLDDVRPEEISLTERALSKLSTMSIEALNKKFLYMQRNDILTKEASMYLIAQSLSTASREEGLILSDEENKLVTVASLDVFLKTRQEEIILMFAKPLPVKKTPINPVKPAVPVAVSEEEKRVFEVNAIIEKEVDAAIKNKNNGKRKKRQKRKYESEETE